MQDRKNNDPFGACEVKHGIGETRRKCAAKFTVHSCVKFGALLNRLKSLVKGFEKFFP